MFVALCLLPCVCSSVCVQHGRCLTCMFTCVSIQNYWGRALPEKFDKLNALRLPFWDRSSTVVATWSADDIDVTKPADIVVCR